MLQVGAVVRLIKACLKNVTASRTSRDIAICSGPARGDFVPFLWPPLSILLRCFLNRAYCFKFCSCASLGDKRNSNLRFIHIRTDFKILLLRFILCVTRVWLPSESRNTYLQVLISGEAFRYYWPHTYRQCYLPFLSVNVVDCLPARPSSMTTRMNMVEHDSTPPSPGRLSI